MLILCLSLLFLFLFSPMPVSAQIPLYYQLLQAYHPSSSSSIVTIATSAPVPITGTVLGVNTTTSSVPKNLSVITPDKAGIGGDGKVTTIALLGDSMIQTLGNDLSALKSALAQYFPNRVFSLLNLGQGSQNIEYGISHELPLALNAKADIIVVESFAYNNFGNSDNGINRHWLDLGAITTSIRQHLPSAKIIIAATIAPNSVTFGNGIADIHFTALEKIEKTSTIKLYLQNAVNFATSQGFPLADAYHLSMSNGQGLKEFISPVDNLHPSILGARLFSDIIADTIAKNNLLNL